MSCDDFKLSETKLRPPSHETTHQNITLSERLVSFDNDTGIGLFRFGPYSDRFKAKLELSEIITSEMDVVLEFNICMLHTHIHDTDLTM